jgi:pimeloyl-ACP methyl ester carboxylesterase
VFIDYPGLGDAPPDASITTTDDLAGWVATRLPPRADLVAISMGSAVALRLLLSHPDRLRRLVLLAPAGGIGVDRFGAVDWRPAFLTRRPTAPRYLVDEQNRLDDRLAAVAHPALLIFGERDTVSPVAVGTFLQSRLQNATLEVVPRATHDIDEEEPDLVASLIEAHLRRAEAE